MCQAKKDGGRRCATHHPATLALKSVAEATTHLNEGQINYVFRNLRQDEVTGVNPTASEYRDHIARVIRNVSRLDLPERTRNRLSRSLNRALTFDQIPNAAAFQAQQRLLEDAKALNLAIDSRIEQLTSTSGRSRRDLTRAFKSAYENTTVGSLHGYTHLGGTTCDPRSESALMQVATDTAPKFEEEPRVTLSAHPQDESVLVGRDPEDGRVEFDYEGNRYAFRNVSDEDWEAIQNSNPLSSLQRLSTTPENRYDDSTSASTDAHRVWCDNCNRYHLASGHVCENGTTRMNLLARADEINESARLGHQVRDAAPFLPNHTSTWQSSSIPTSVEVETSPGSAREGRTTNALRFGPTPEQLAAEFRSNGGQSIVFSAGRMIPIRGEDGYHEVTHEYRLSPQTNNVGARIQQTSRRLRCTCPDYQANYRCQHSHPTSENGRLRGNVLALRDARAQVEAISEAVGANVTPEYQYMANLDENGHLTPEQLTEIQNLRGSRSNRLLVVDADGNEGVYVWDSRQQTLTSETNRGMASVDAQVGSMSFQRLDEVQSVAQAFNSWQLSESGRAAVVERQVPTREPGYRENVDQFLADYRTAQESEPTPIVMGPVTNGALSEGPGPASVGYGVELEVNCSYREAERIAERLNSMNLSDVDYVVGYHSGEERWRVEEDCTVGAEIVSPILYDNAEDWRTLNSVIQVIREEGGEVGDNTGGHIHIGRRSGDSNRQVLAASMAHMDVFRRLSTEPNRGQHRTLGGNGYTSPFSDEVISGIYSADNLDRRGGFYRENSVNLVARNTVEFREPDSSLDAGRIQTQVMMCAAIMDSARNDSWDNLTRENFATQLPGTNRTRVSRIETLRHGEDPNSDEMILAREHPLMSSLDTLFRSHEQRRRVLRETARAPWQEAVRRRGW